MKIALDVSSASRPQSTGVAMYIHRMMAGFSRVGNGHQFYAVTSLSRPKNALHLPPLPDSNFSRKLMVPGFHPIFSRSVDVFHGLDARLPGKWMKARTAVTIHDVFSSLQSTEFATADFRAMKRNRYQELVKRADRIICVSNAVKRDVIATLNPDASKLRVVYEAGGEGFSPRPAADIERARTKYKLDRPYFIFVGSINKRKNVPALVRGFLQGRAAAKSDALFAIAGRIGFGGDEIRAAIESSPQRDAVRLLGYVPDEDVPALYSGAHALLFATLYEGFGIPAVEAFACGCPVIGANVGSLPEIVGDTGLLADPKSVDSIAEQVAKFLQDETLRKSCVARGIERAKQFSWDRAARECLEIYRDLLP